MESGGRCLQAYVCRILAGRFQSFRFQNALDYHSADEVLGETNKKEFDPFISMCKSGMDSNSIVDESG